VEQALTLAGSDSAPSAGSTASEAAHPNSHSRGNRLKTCVRNRSGI
jgi:hypothetical protein